jgi:hypothetical protein
MVAKAAESIPGLDPRQVFATRDSAAMRRQATAFDDEAAAANVTGTPTLFVGKSGASLKQSPSPAHRRAHAGAADRGGRTRMMRGARLVGQTATPE